MTLTGFIKLFQAALKLSKTHTPYCYMFPVFPVSLPRLLTEAEKSLGNAKMAVK